MFKDVKTLSLHVNVHLKLTSTHKFNNQIDRRIYSMDNDLLSTDIYYCSMDAQGVHGDMVTMNTSYSWYQQHELPFSKDDLTTAYIYSLIY